jgi:hypothetical protein
MFRRKRFASGWISKDGENLKDINMPQGKENDQN